MNVMGINAIKQAINRASRKRSRDFLNNSVINKKVWNIPVFAPVYPKMWLLRVLNTTGATENRLKILFHNAFCLTSAKYFDAGNNVMSKTKTTEILF